MNQLKIFGEKLLEAPKKYKNLIVLGSDFLRECGVSGFLETYGERCFNLGHAEGNTVSAAAGFAVRGKLPLLVGFSSGLVLRAFDQIRSNICEPNLNVKIIAVDNPHENFSNDVELIKILPNIKIFFPKNEKEFETAFEKALEEYGPVYLKVN